jgi:hypothetical protein
MCYGVYINRNPREDPDSYRDQIPEREFGIWNLPIGICHHKVAEFFDIRNPVYALTSRCCRTSYTGYVLL